MEDPVSELDERFSDPGAGPTSWEQAREVLEQAELSWISTVRADGRPHVTPLVAVWHDGRLHFCTGPQEQKALNLAHNPRVVVTTGDGRWDAGLDVVVEGRAERVTDPRLLEELAGRWRSKWDGRWEFEPTVDGFGHTEGGPAQVWSVEPDKVLAFAKGTFSHTRHRPR